MPLELGSLRKALDVLARALAAHGRAEASDDAGLAEATRGGVIHAFEVAYEQSWKLEMIDLDAGQLAEVRSILRAQVPECEVRAFGSRVEGRARAFSDLDLALLGPEKLDWRRIETLRDAFAESDLPIQVDVLDWNAISEAFRSVIARRCEVIQAPEGSAA